MDIQLALSGSKWIGYPIRSIVIPAAIGKAATENTLADDVERIIRRRTATGMTTEARIP